MKSLPHNNDAEEAVLGACLIEGPCIDQVGKILSPADFYNTSHQIIMAAMLQLRQIGEPADMITLTNALRTSGKLEEAGGPAKLTRLIDSTPTAANVEYYAGIVLEKSRLRDICHNALKAYNSAIDENSLSDNILDETLKNMLSLNERASFRKGNDHWLISDGINEISEALTTQLPFNEQGTIPGIDLHRFVKTGFKDFDYCCGGLRPSYFGLLAGRPGMGKTTLAINMMLNMLHMGLRVCFFSFEVSKRLTTQRFLAAESRVGTDKISRGPINENQYQKITSSCGSLSELKLHIFSRQRSVSDMKKDIDEVTVLHGKPDIVMIDRLEYIKEKQEKNENRTQFIDRITNELAQEAIRLDIPIICLMQLNRKCEERSDKRPVLSDLRDSGGSEQNAKMVLFVYRDDYYDPKKNPGEAEIIISKNSDGSVGTVPLSFKNKFPLFEDLSIEPSTSKPKEWEGVMI